MSDVKPAPGLHTLRAVPAADQGLPDADAEGRRRVVMQLLERGVKPSDDLLGVAEYIEKGYATEEDKP